MADSLKSLDKLTSPNATRGSGLHLFRRWSWVERPATAPHGPRELGEVLPVGDHRGVFRIDDVRIEGGGEWEGFLGVVLGERIYVVPLSKPVWVPSRQTLRVKAEGDDTAGTGRAVIVGQWFAKRPRELE